MGAALACPWRTRAHRRTGPHHRCHALAHTHARTRTAPVDLATLPPTRLPETSARHRHRRHVELHPRPCCSPTVAAARSLLPLTLAAARAWACPRHHVRARCVATLVPLNQRLPLWCTVPCHRRLAGHGAAVAHSRAGPVRAPWSLPRRVAVLSLIRKFTPRQAVVTSPAMAPRRPSCAKANRRAWSYSHNCACLEVEQESSFAPSLPLWRPYGVGASIGVFPHRRPLKSERRHPAN